MSRLNIDAVPHLYDGMAREYARHAEGSVYNAHYDRPAVLGLLPDMAGKRVLDIGCGPGIYAEWLVNCGACVVGFDISSEMIDVARQRVGDRAVFHVHDAGQPLTFADDASFDVAIAPLVIHYVSDRVSALTDVARVLAADGLLVVSTQHPFADWQRHGGSYFATELVEETWRTASAHVKMPFGGFLSPPCARNSDAPDSLSTESSSHSRRSRPRRLIAASTRSSWTSRDSSCSASASEAS